MKAGLDTCLKTGLFLIHNQISLIKKNFTQVCLPNSALCNVRKLDKCKRNKGATRFGLRIHNTWSCFHPIKYLLPDLHSKAYQMSNKLYCCLSTDYYVWVSKMTLEKGGGHGSHENSAACCC